MIRIIMAVCLDLCFQLGRRCAQMSLVDDTWEDGDYFKGFITVIFTAIYSNETNINTSSDVGG